ncbi:MAG: Unknown protein [uncultured Sulfurovum sp.]|uniref:Uncharacterized protein n=1 Tax=uncultured Sulfurovum sp. TaxID=269237 RepID=A0A6S6TGS5_9BACT|nr:MAG: Unknown protein [uncultured Sulfurovum sp.]
MIEIPDSILHKILWEAFTSYMESAKDFVLRVYIAKQVNALEQLEDVSNEEIEEITDIIEATIINTPDDIKQMKSEEEKKEVFQEYIKKTKYINNGTIQGIQHQHNEGGVINNNFGNVHNYPNQ